MYLFQIKYAFITSADYLHERNAFECRIQIYFTIAELKVQNIGIIYFYLFPIIRIFRIRKFDALNFKVNVLAFFTVYPGFLRFFTVYPGFLRFFTVNPGF